MLETPQPLFDTCRLTRARNFHNGVLGKIAGNELRGKKILFNVKREKLGKKMIIFKFWKNSSVCTVCTVCSLQSVFLHDCNFHGGFWQCMANRHDSPWSALQFPDRSQSFQRSLLVLWNLDYILSQNNIHFRAMEILVHNDERTISNSFPCL